MSCAQPDKQLFDWGMMRLRRPLYGIGDAFATEVDDQFRKKRDAEVVYLYTVLYTCLNLFDTVKEYREPLVSNIYVVSLKTEIFLTE